MTTFNVYRRYSTSESPVQIATGLTVKSYSDTTVTQGVAVLYSIGAVKNGIEKISDEISTFSTEFSVTSLLHFDSNFNDVKGNVWTTYNTPTISSTQSKFGGASCYLINSNQQYLQTTYSTNFDLLGGAFTVECWVYLNSIPSDGPRIFSTSGGAVAFNTTNGIHVLFQVSGGKVAAQINNASGVIGIASSSSVTTGAWHHISVCYDGSALYVSLDGIVSSAAGVAYRPSANPIPAIGTIYNEDKSNTTYLINGYIDEFRITKGIARYTENFTPPTTAFSDV